jgi:hypothetical protein
MNKASVSIGTPIIFADGTSFYATLSKTYIRHDRGLFILAPSGVGKTHFVSGQSDGAMHWIDGDTLWVATNADPTDDDWEDNFSLVQAVNARCDVITYQAMQLGFWIMGASNQFLKPDAIVIPSWETHLGYIKQREGGDYDGGAKEKDLEGLKSHIKWIKHWEAEGVPCFTTIEEAVACLTQSSTD